MLPAPHRLTRGDDLRRAIKGGRRSGGAILVVHLLARDDAGPVRVGFVVSRAVGNAVTRHRVQRQLRHLCRDRLSLLPAHSDLVVRGLPAAAAASYVELGAELDRCLQRCLRAASGPEPRTVS